MLKFTIRPAVQVGDDPVEREVTAPALVLTAEQAVALGFLLVEAGRVVQNEIEERSRPATAKPTRIWPIWPITR